MSFDDRKNWRAERQSRELAEYDRITQRENPNDKGICACGKFKLHTCLVCKSCWFSVPEDLRKSYFCNSPRERRIARLTIIRLALARSPEFKKRISPNTPESQPTTKVTII